MPAKSAFGSTYAEDVLVAAGTRTVSGDSGVLSGWGEASALRVQLEVTAPSSPRPTALKADDRG